MATINLTKDGFEKRISSIESMENSWQYLGDKPAVIDFYASWCGPCKMLSPILEDLSEEYSGKIDIYKVNVDSEEELSAFHSNERTTAKSRWSTVQATAKKHF